MSAYRVYTFLLACLQRSLLLCYNYCGEKHMSCQNLSKEQTLLFCGHPLFLPR